MEKELIFSTMFVLLGIHRHSCNPTPLDNRSLIQPQTLSTTQSRKLHSNRTITDRGEPVVQAGLLLLALRLGPSKKTYESVRNARDQARDQAHIRY